MIDLIHYEAARNALEAAVKFDDVMSIKDKAKHAELYARQAKDTYLIEKATEIKVRAERKAGQMLATSKESGDIRKPGNPQLSNDTTIGLNDIGITRDQSSRWQKLAAIDDEKFEKAVESAKQVAGEVTTAAMLRIEKANRVKEEKSKESNQPQLSNDTTIGTSENDGVHNVDEDLQNYDPRDDLILELKERISDLEIDNAVSALPEDGQADAFAIIHQLKENLKKSEAMLKQATQKRDELQNENSSLKNQIKYLESQVKKLHKEMGGDPAKRLSN